MRKLSPLAGFLLGAILAVPGVHAAHADEPATRRLIEQALHWQKKGRDDLASGVWQKLLLADPLNGEALIELGNIEARAGRTQTAENFLNRAKALPNPPGRLGELETALAVSRSKPGELAAARKEAETGNSEQALTRYQSILGANVKPDGQLGLEYYQTLGGTKGGWEEARRGLESLAQKNPGDDRYLLALARHLTYRDAPRREGIRQLASLANRSHHPDEVQKAWRQALAWLGAVPTDLALYSAYLRRFPADSAIRERMRQAEKSRVVYRPGPEQIARQTGFRMLNAGELVEAESKFTKILQKNPRDADALGGLGIVRMRQEKFAEALQLIEQAIRVGGRSSRWESARRSARYWLDLQPVFEAQANGSLQGQEKAIRQAIRLDGDEPTAQVLLADLLSEQRKWQEAESIYRHVLKSKPYHPGAFRGLMSLMVDTGRGQEALAQIERLDPRKIEAMGGLNQAKAATLVKIAETYERAGDTENALIGLEDALLIDPSSPATRMALARLYQRLGEQGAANALLEDLQASHQDLPEVQEVRAALLAEQGRWWEALRALEQVPPSRRTPALVREQKRYWVNVQAERARQFFAKGQQSEAQSIVSHAEQAAADDAGLQGVVASAWADIGQMPKAMRLLRQAASRGGANVGLRMQYAGMLLNMKLDVELLAVLRELAEMENLTAREQSDLNNIIVAYTLRQTDVLREAGRLAEAYDTLAPVLQQSSDSRLQMAMARIYNSSREPENALRIAEEVILREPEILEHRLFAANVALGARAYERASEHAEAALALAPDHPRVLATVGRVEKARGNLGRAMEYFQYAQALEKDNRAFAGVPGNLSLRLVDRQGAVEKPASTPRPSNILPLPGGSRGHRSLVTNNSSRYNEFDEPVVPQGRGTTRQTLPLPPVERSQTLVQPIQPKSGKRKTAVLPLASNANYPGADEGYVMQAVRQDASTTPRYENLSQNMPPYPSDTPVANRYPLLAERAEPSSQFPAAQRRPTVKERSVEDEIRDISLQYSPTLSIGGGFRDRSGEIGMSRLTSVEAAVEVRLPVDFDAGVVLRMTQVLLDAGKIDLTKADNATRFGSAGLGSYLVPGTFQSRTQDEHGVALSLAIQNNNVSADIGTTPLGFPIRNMVGGFSLKTNFEGATLRGGLSRRPVTDSLLSYAGTLDPLTGKKWGGVVKTGGGLDFTAGDDEGGAYFGLGGYSLTGEMVKGNRLVEGGLGGYWRAYQSTDTQLTLGVNITAMSYQYNLGFFTLGHGGYFSPQRYVAFGIPFDIAGRRGRFAYQFGGDVGVRTIKQDDALYYPADANLQTAWENPAQSLTNPTRYAGTDSNGLGYKFFGKVEYSVTDNLAIGGRFTSDNSRNYNQQQGLVYIRHAFDGLNKPIVYPPRTLRLFSEGEPL